MIKIILNLINKKKYINQQGFTLIELLIVLVFFSILIVIAIPAFLRQVGKSREVEASNFLGGISRAQQAYHFENQTFATSIAALDITISNNYYNYPDPTIVNSSIVKHQANAINPSLDQVRNLASGIYHSAGNIDIIICQGANVGEVVESPNSPSENCSNNGIRIR